MKRVLDGIIILVAVILVVLGVGLGAQLRAAFWQKLIAVGVFVVVAYGLMMVGRKMWRRG